MGASATDLMALGIAGEPARRIGGTIATAVAGVGTAQTGAAAITGTVNSVTTASGQTAFILPLHNPGRTVEIYNTSATTALVYPPVGGAIQGGSTNASFSVAQNKGAIFRYITLTQIVAILSA